MISIREFDIKEIGKTIFLMVMGYNNRKMERYIKVFSIKDQDFIWV